MKKKWIIANWKMNALQADSIDRVMTLKKNLPSSYKLQHLNYRVVLCPPTILLSIINTLCEDSMLMIGAQDCHSEPSGSFTGGISAEMIRDIGGSLVLVGHSEQRLAGDMNETVKAKATAVVRTKMLPVLCVGEDVHARAIGKDKDVVNYQLMHSMPGDASNILIAYEPVWAIGTGKSADEIEITNMFENIEKFMHRNYPHIRFALCYGGSVTSQNAADLLEIPNCSGLLVGGASLDTSEFLQIVKAVQ